MDNKLTGSFISYRRKELGLNQKQLAERLNITDKAVSKWETGRSAPDISMLIPLAETLDVSVVEILKGEKVEMGNFTNVSDETVVNTMKTGRRKIIVAVMLSVVVMLSLSSFCMASYFGYHYMKSIPVEDDEIIEKTTEIWLRHPSTSKYISGEAEIVKRDKKGDYFLYLLRYDDSVVLSIFRRNKIFKDRISYLGGTSTKEKNTVQVYSGGESNLTINAFIGYGMTDKSYTYRYRGVISTKAVEGEYILDALIDINDGFSNAGVLYPD